MTSTTFFGGAGAFFITKGFLEIRRGRIAKHREWMIRAFAVFLGISAVRIVGVLFDLILTPTGYSPRFIFSLSLWIGWAATLATAELWIRRSRTATTILRYGAAQAGSAVQSVKFHHITSI